LEQVVHPWHVVVGGVLLIISAFVALLIRNFMSGYRG
jgi:hypothetical protein